MTVMPASSGSVSNLCFHSVLIDAVVSPIQRTHRCCSTRYAGYWLWLGQPWSHGYARFSCQTEETLEAVDQVAAVLLCALTVLALHMLTI